MSRYDDDTGLEDTVRSKIKARLQKSEMRGANPKLKYEFDPIEVLHISSDVPWASDRMVYDQRDSPTFGVSKIADSVYTRFHLVHRLSGGSL